MAAGTSAGKGAGHSPSISLSLSLVSLSLSLFSLFSLSLSFSLALLLPPSPSPRFPPRPPRERATLCRMSKPVSTTLDGAWAPVSTSQADKRSHSRGHSTVTAQPPHSHGHSTVTAQSQHSHSTVTRASHKSAECCVLCAWAPPFRERFLLSLPAVAGPPSEAVKIKPKSKRPSRRARSICSALGDAACKSGQPGCGCRSPPRCRHRRRRRRRRRRGHGLAAAARRPPRPGQVGTGWQTGPVLLFVCVRVCACVCVCVF